MKKTALFLTIAAALLLAGCHSDIDDRITQLKQDVSELEIRVSRLNESLNSLSELVGALEKNDHITNISESGSGADKTYRITFASGSTLTFHNGSEGVSPIVGIQYDDNYKSYYWTIQMGPDSSPTWMTNSYGQRVKATGSVPQLKIEDGVWWYSFDGSGWSKCNWGPTQGEAGSSVFVTVDTSDPYFVRFVLTSWVGIKMPTQKAFDELNDQCRKLNESFKSYTDIINSINGNTFVKSVAEYKQGDDSGYRFTLESGKVISIRTGRSSRDSVLLSAKAYTDGKYYWVFRNKSSEKYQWLKYNDKMICVTMTDVTPRISIQQVSGSLYFAVSVEGGEPELMLDEKGNPVEATGTMVPDFFSKVDLSDPSAVILTMTDGSVIRLPRGRQFIPTMELSLDHSYIEPNTGYSYELLLFVNDTLPSTTELKTFAEYHKASGVNIEAIALDDGYVREIEEVSITPTKISKGVAFSLVYDVKFTTGDGGSWDTTRKFRIAIFLNWMNQSIMKVAEFDRHIAATSLKLTSTTLTVAKGKTSTLKYTFAPANTTDKIEWSSDNPSVAKVSDKGVVTGVAAGTCTITATLGTLTATCKCTVTG
ncbi:MAG: Ig-like domain-containing protein [Bacteroidales bacterium]|nr:Ig-like domain-containing protein [Bacteroidales bacterium]